MDRRALLRLGGAAAIAALPAYLLLRRRSGVAEPGQVGEAHVAETEAKAAIRGGALSRDPAGILDLHPKLRYRVLERAGERMSDGYLVPGAPDGMASFELPGGRWALLRNHEIDTQAVIGAYSKDPPPEAYNPKAFGGVSRVVIDPKSGEKISSNLVLTGTRRNCCGGPSPWGWLTCEESVEEGHGYVFLARHTAEKLERPQIIKGYGRYNHEAACIDPKTNIAYLTEDRPNSCFYRFVPKDKERPFEGKLQAMRHASLERYSLSENMGKDKQIEVEWVDVPEPDPSGDTVRSDSQDKGALLLSRGEGIWFHDGDVYICSTNGGAEEAGQIFRLRLAGSPGNPNQRDRLELLYESHSRDVLDMPDNITLSSSGSVFMAEDGPDEQLIRALTPKGKIVDIARNRMSESEFAGVCFSPDGSTLFVNIQHDGLTLAISGPFDELTRA